MFHGCFGDLLGIIARTLDEKYILSPNHVDILSFDNIFSECNIAKGVIFKRKRNGVIHNWTMTVDPGYKDVEKLPGGNNWYMMETKDVISSISFKLKNEKNEMVSFSGQSISFRLSIKEI